MLNADLRGVTMRGAELVSVNFAGADFRRADLSGSDLTGSTFDRAKLQRANLCRADVTDVLMRGAQVSKADFTNVIGIATVDMDGAKGKAIGLPKRTVVSSWAG